MWRREFDNLHGEGGARQFCSWCMDTQIMYMTSQLVIAKF